MTKKSKKVNVTKIFNRLLSILAAVNAVLLFFIPSNLNQGGFLQKLDIYLFSSATILCLAVVADLFLALKNKNIPSVLRSKILDILAVSFYFTAPQFFYPLILYIIGRQSYYLLSSVFFEKAEGKIYKSLSNNPAWFVVLSFVFTILVGTLLLLLPVSTNTLINPNNSTSVLGALFTSTSATCVTGLAVYDTGSHFTTFGQLVILALIQVGGLGIMTISTSFAILLGQKMTLRSESLMQNVVGGNSRVDMFYLIKSIVGVTLGFELIGAILLYIKFNGLFASGWQTAYYAVFHSVSAFCNAGFSLWNDSFVRFQGSWLLNLTISFLIIFGGLGFSVIMDMKKNIVQSYKPQRLSLHSKLVLSSTAVLILLGTVFYFISEYCGMMKNYDFNTRVVSSLFQSVSTRTAGFNTIDNGLLTSGGVFISLILMLIGASPGSTGGGLKTTSVAIFVLAVWSIVTGDKSISAYKRRISIDTLKKVLALFALALGALIVLTFALMIVEKNNLDHNLSFSQLIFESCSAFATVGLSMGITSKLTVMGKIIIIILMFLGRVGPLTFIFAISSRRKKLDITYTEETIGIG